MRSCVPVKFRVAVMSSEEGLCVVPLPVAIGAAAQLLTGEYTIRGSSSSTTTTATLADIARGGVDGGARKS